MMFTHAWFRSGRALSQNSNFSLLRNTIKNTGASGNRFQFRHRYYSGNSTDELATLLAKLNKYKLRIFLSYSWKNEKEADRLDEFFKKTGIRVTRDKRDAKYNHNLKQFMKSVREHDYAIMLVSKNWLTSFNCMYEMREFAREEEYQDKFFPIVLDDAKLYNLSPEGPYVNYWTEERKKLRSGSEGIPAERVRHTYENISGITDIINGIGKIIEVIKLKIGKPLKDLESEQYCPMLEEMLRHQTQLASGDKSGRKLSSLVGADSPDIVSPDNSKDRLSLEESAVFSSPRETERHASTVTPQESEKIAAPTYHSINTASSSEKGTSTGAHTPLPDQISYYEAPKEILKKLDTALFEIGTRQRSLVVNVWGQGRSGKTQFALRALKNLQNSWRVIEERAQGYDKSGYECFWLRAHDKESLWLELNILAIHLGVRIGRTGDMTKEKGCIQDGYAQYKGNLALVFDNITPEDYKEIGGFIPQNGDHITLLTSRKSLRKDGFGGELFPLDSNSVMKEVREKMLSKEVDSLDQRQIRSILEISDNPAEINLISSLLAFKADSIAQIISDFHVRKRIDNGKSEEDKCVSYAMMQWGDVLQNKAFSDPGNIYKLCSDIVYVCCYLNKNLIQIGLLQSILRHLERDYKFNLESVKESLDFLISEARIINTVDWSGQGTDSRDPDKYVSIHEDYQKDKKRISLGDRSGEKYLKAIVTALGESLSEELKQKERTQKKETQRAATLDQAGFVIKYLEGEGSVYLLGRNLSLLNEFGRLYHNLGLCKLHIDRNLTSAKKVFEKAIEILAKKEIPDERLSIVLKELQIALAECRCAEGLFLLDMGSTIIDRSPIWKEMEDSKKSILNFSEDVAKGDLTGIAYIRWLTTLGYCHLLLKENDYARSRFKEIKPRVEKMSDVGIQGDLYLAASLYGLFQIDKHPDDLHAYGKLTVDSCGMNKDYFAEYWLCMLRLHVEGGKIDDRGIQGLKSEEVHRGLASLYGDSGEITRKFYTDFVTKDIEENRDDNVDNRLGF